MAGASKVRWDRSRIDGNVDRSGSILRADAGRNSEPGCSIDAYGEGCSLLFSILFALLRKLKLWKR